MLVANIYVFVHSGCHSSISAAIATPGCEMRAVPHRSRRHGRGHHASPRRALCHWRRNDGDRCTGNLLCLALVTGGISPFARLRRGLRSWVISHRISCHGRGRLVEPRSGVGIVRSVGRQFPGWSLLLPVVASFLALAPSWHAAALRHSEVPSALLSMSLWPRKW